MSLSYLRLTRHSLRTQRRTLLVWVVAIFLLGLLTVTVWPSMKDNDALSSFSEGLPPPSE